MPTKQSNPYRMPSPSHLPALHWQVHKWDTNNSYQLCRIAVSFSDTLLILILFYNY